MTKLRLFCIVLAVLACQPAVACLLTNHVGSCGNSGPHPITTPTIVPQPSTFFTQSNNSAGNVGLKTASGAFSLPSSDPQSSFSIYGEVLVNPAFNGGLNWILGNGSLNNGLFVSASAAPILGFQASTTTFGGGPWWLPTGASNGITANLTTSKATNGFPGYYPWQAATSGTGAACPSANGVGARPPQGFFNQSTGGGGTADPGLLCGATSAGTGAAAAAGSINGLGIAQAATITGCASNSPATGEFQITLTTSIAHGIEPGSSFALNSASANAGFNTNYTATAAGGSTGAWTLTGFSATTGTCPVTSGFGTATLGAGTAGAVSYGVPPINPFIQNQTTGIQLSPNQRSCLLVGENGDDTNFPGSQFAYATKYDGTALPGASTPVLSPWLNMGAVNFNGYISSGLQTTGPTPALTVTSMASYAISAATTTGNSGQLWDVQFTIGSGNPFIVGSEFTVAGVTPSAFNGTYVAVAGSALTNNWTPGTTLYGKLLSGPVGVPTTFPGSSDLTIAGTAVGVIMPGMEIIGANFSAIAPYGVYGSTGLGGVGTYGMTATQSATAVTTSATTSGVMTTATPGLTRLLTIGDLVSCTTCMAGGAYTGTVVAIAPTVFASTTLTGSGAAGTYGISPSPTSAIASGLTLGPMGNAGTTTPVNMYAANGFYYNLVNTSGGALPGGAVTVRTSVSTADLISVIGSDTSTSTGATSSGWGGAIGNVGMYQGVFPNTNGSPSTSAFNSLCQKTTDFQSFATTNSGAWKSLHRLNDPGLWADSSVAQFNGTISGASLTVNSTQSGALPTVTGGLPAITIAGAGIAGCPSTCPTISSGSAGVYTLSASGGTVGPEAMTAGNFKPAIPIPSIPLTGSIAGNTLTVTNVAPAVNPWSATAVSLNAAGTTLTFSGATGTLTAGQCLIDSLGLISPSAPLCVSSLAGSTATIQVNYLPGGFVFPTTPTTDTLYAYQTRVIAGQYVTDTTGGITTPAMVTGQLTQAVCSSGTPIPIPAVVFGECGTYALSTSANGTVPSSGTEQMFMSGVGTAGAIAPGSALTIENVGHGVIYPVTLGATPLLGTMQINGTYNVASLGGTPAAIQARVSATPGGPALSGCTACDWTSLSSATLSGGNWSGNVVSIPAGSPYYISVRASNGIGYVTMPNSVGVGANVALFGQGNTGWLISTNTTASFMSGLGQEIGYAPGPVTGSATQAVYGPPVINNLSPFAPIQFAVDAYSSGGFVGEGTTAIIQNINKILAGSGITVPVGLVNMGRNGVSFINQWWDNLPQAQTLGIGDGSSTVFSSGAGFGGTVGGSMTFATHTATASIATTGVMTVTSAISDSWNALAPGEAVTIGAYSGTIVAAAPTVTSAGVVLSGYGTTGTYQVAPAPGSAVGSGTLTFTHNILGFNAALGYGAGITGAYSAPGGVNTLTVNSFTSGMTTLAPTMVVSDGSASSTLLACLTGCTQAVPPSGATWKLSDANLSADTGSTAMYAQAAGGSLMPGVPSQFMSPQHFVMSLSANAGNGQGQLIRYGTFKVLKNGVVVCSDTTTTFTWQLAAAPCTDAGAGVVNSANSWVNYQYGTYSIAFNSPPSSGDTITAQWNNCATMNNDAAWNNICWVGSGKNQDGVYSTLAAKSGGINVWLNAQQGLNGGLNLMTYQAKSNNYTFATNLARLHNGQPNMPMYTSGQTRWEGAQQFYGFASDQAFFNELYFGDSVVPSSFNGSVSAQGGTSGAYTAVLTLSGAAIGTMWEGELIECAPAGLACASTSLAAGQGLPPQSEIVGICTVALCGSASPSGWGTNGSTYLLASTGTAAFANTIGGPFAMENSLYYYPGPSAYIGPANDVMLQVNVAPVSSSPEQQPGPFSSIRTGQRNGVEMAAAIAGNPSLGSPPTVTRSKLTGCDASSTTMPCFDVSSTYQASHAATWSGAAATITGGLSAGDRPFVPGMALSCSGCNMGLVILSVSLPPTQSTAAGAGQVGQTFIITASGTIGGSGSGTLTGGCSGTAGVGANCVDIGFDINTGGTYGGQAAQLDTCGVNNIVGTNDNSLTTPPFMTTATNYLNPNGSCVPTGIGSFVWGFRIGTAPENDNLNTTLGSIFTSVGSSWGDGNDQGYQNGVILQNQAFTCNLVAAKIVQCILSPQRNLPGQTPPYGTSASNGAFSGIGQWPASGTYVSYGDAYSSGYLGGLIGNAGGQSFPFTAGSGYTVPVSGNASSSSGFTTVGGLCPIQAFGATPQVVTMGVAINGGAISDVYPTNMGVGTYGQCAFPIGYQVFGAITGASGNHATLTIASANTDSITAGASDGSGAAGTSLVVVGNAGTDTIRQGSAVSGSNVKTLTATASSGSTSLNVTAASGISLVVGTQISGAGVPAGTTITGLGVVGGAAYTLSHVTTAAVTNPTATNAIAAGTTVVSGGPATTGTFTLSASSFVDAGTTLTITNSNIVTTSGTIAVGTAASVPVVGTTPGYASLTLGSTLNSGALFPLVITACPGGTCGIAGTYTAQNLNPAGTAVTSWTTGITNNTGTPPAQTGPVAQGAVISGGSLPAGSYISLAFMTVNTGYIGTYPIICPTTCANSAAGLLNIGLQSGSGGSITTPPLSPVSGVGGIGTYDSDNNLTGLYVCDNSGAVSGNPLWGMFNFGYSNGTTSTMTAPGLCAKPFGMHRGLQVTGASVTSALTAPCLIDLPFSICPASMN